MKRAKFVVCALSFAVLIASDASAAKTTEPKIDPTQVQKLANDIETALAALGPAATLQQDETAIQTTIAASGDTPAVVKAALHLVEQAKNLPANATLAATDVDKTIQLANAAPRAGGAQGQSAFSAPPTVAAGGGSDYVP